MSENGYCGARLVANARQSFQGSIVLGKGFILSPQQAEDLILRDPRNKDVLFPYLNGEDLNSRPDSSASRWVINFHDWPEERAREYTEPFAIVERDVKPERLKNNRKVYRDYWWQYAEKRPAMLKAVEQFDRVLVVALVSRTVMPISVPTGQVFSHMLGIFATSEMSQLALLDSGIHGAWVAAQASTLETRIRYTPSDVYETMPQPAAATAAMTAAGAELTKFRQMLMRERQLGLTKLYNLVHDPKNTDSEIEDLRGHHRAVDEAVVNAYGWLDLNIEHNFFDTRQGKRFTFPGGVRTEILNRLLELNHEEYERIDKRNSAESLLF
ncbi:type IIL restriction-modification enzyme MmeI [Streptomyces coelicoflavus]|uniref:type IIL restriction-modification enzyme MmeI n=1 Tax=Streptomyces coelicoflavus TaxID=285562 RepID=UPI003677E2FB